MDDLVRSRLREAIAEKGLLVKEVASMAGVNRRTLEGWVGSRGSRPNVVEFARVAKVLNKPVEWFTDENFEFRYAPQRLIDVLEVLNSLSDEDLAIVANLAISLAERDKHKSAASGRASGQGEAIA
jgi:transcriptional regulator with XRE-family HTH domain